MKTTRKETNLWELIKRFYKETFDIPEYVIEFISLQNILKRCASGYSSWYIARVEQLPVSYVKDAINYGFGFDGWEQDLDFNALAVYNNSDREYNQYTQNVQLISIMTNPIVLRMSYNTCKRYYEIVEEINKYVK